MGGRQRWRDRVCERERGGREGERERGRRVGEGEVGGGLWFNSWQIIPHKSFFFFFLYKWPPGFAGLCVVIGGLRGGWEAGQKGMISFEWSIVHRFLCAVCSPAEERKAHGQPRPKMDTTALETEPRCEGHPLQNK